MYNQPTVTVVVPVYREGNHLTVVIRAIIAALETATSKEFYEIVLIDDGSPDNTWEVIREISQNYSILRAVRLSRNFGKECALCAGLEIAKGKAVIIMVIVLLVC